MRLLMAIVTVAVLVAVFALPGARADWDPNNPADQAAAKMHFPQLPNPTGWDVEFLTSDQEIADDWVCSETGPITDFHFWTSWYQDSVTVTWIQSITIKIYDNDTSGPFPKPGTVLWTQTFTDYTMIPYGSGPQGWSNPQQGISGWEPWVPGNHNLFQQVNITNVQSPFEQQAGTTYWLGIYVLWFNSHNPVGWKTADVSAYPTPYTGAPYSGTAVWWDYINQVWRELENPLAANEPYDLAFVITSTTGVPTLGEWGMILLAVLLLAAGVVVVRRRRALPAT